MGKKRVSAKFKQLNAERIGLVNRMFTDEGLTEAEQKRLKELESDVGRENAKFYDPVIIGLKGRRAKSAGRRVTKS